jgi:hypothetical protein
MPCPQTSLCSQCCSQMCCPCTSASHSHCGHTRVSLQHAAQDCSYPASWAYVPLPVVTQPPEYPCRVLLKIPYWAAGSLLNWRQATQHCS